MMLDLTDPLWEKLDSAERDQDVRKLLSELAQTWDQDKADSLFWDCLIHQGTCYGATYAAIPHLLAIAELDENRRQRCEVAVFLGYVTLCALEHDQRPLFQDSLKRSTGGIVNLIAIAASLQGTKIRANPVRSTIEPSDCRGSGNCSRSSRSTLQISKKYS